MNRVIAIVEDDASQRQHYAEALRNSGYEVIEFADRKSALASFELSMPDLAILDIILGDEVGGGFEVCRYLKDRDAQFPIIFLTSRGDELDKIYGLQLGAWDYQTKPISLEFLITRVRSLFQIKESTNQSLDNSKRLQMGHLLVDESTMSIQWKEQPINLTPTEYDILQAILNSPDGVSIEALIKATKQGVVEDNTINTHILHLRKKFKQVDAGFNCIKTKYGFGYGWIC
ncbi:MAG: response regulator transcription factor [Gammaproteobacteria bacterium]|nr:response regulator transcription factor [Gammaproteobacteria bacterium]MCW8888368.1 response regulator transcription factor [Gammaproteobacteria bacterium]